MKMKKILAMLLSFVLILGTIPTAFAASTGLSLSIEADITDASAGDTINFTVYANGANTLAGGVLGGSFTVNIPAGLTLVAGSFKDAKESGLTVSVNEGNMGVAMAGTDGFTAAQVALVTFTCTLDADAVGPLTVDFVIDDETCLNGAELDYYYSEDTFAMYGVEISVHAHSFGEEWLNDKDNHWHVCACGEIADKAAHETEVIPAVPATCTETGLTEGAVCTVCGIYTIEQDVVKTIDHVYEVKSETDEEIVYGCKNCDATYTEEVKSNVEVDVNENGDVIIKTENEDGSVTTEVRGDNGTITTTTDENGNVLSTEVALNNSAVASGEVVELPVDAIVANSETTITITTNSNEDVAVLVPVEDVTPGSVVVIVYADGTEEIVTATKMTENGLVFDCPNGATIKVVDNAQTFADVAGDEWYNDALAYVSARGIMNGMDDGSFSGAANTTRAQFWTMLARLAGVDTTAAEGADWYAAAQAWIIEVGVSDGTRANDEISREEIVTMLYRYITEVMGVDVASAPIEFSDAADVSDWAQAAMEWACSEGVMGGYTDGTIKPNGDATRSEIAQLFMNFMQNA